MIKDLKVHFARVIKSTLLSFIMSKTCFYKNNGFGKFFTLWLIFFLSISAEEINKNECKGPIRYYEELKCKPIYENPGDICASRYDCSHLDNRSTKKCYANGHKYAINETLKSEDRATPCDICFCGTNENTARFYCAIVDCFPKELEPGCYQVRDVKSCCKSEIKCPKNPNDRAKCKVDGKTYLEGEFFYPKDENHNPLVCVCSEGYKGENVAPFCRKSSCGLEIRNSVKIRQNCAPTYRADQSLIDNCPQGFKCQAPDDTIIHKHRPTKDEQKKCKYGDKKLEIGDYIAQKNNSVDRCLKCECQVPPTLTCQQLSAQECEKIKSEE